MTTLINAYFGFSLEFSPPSPAFHFIQRYIDIAFNGDFGDLPPLASTTTGLTKSSGSPSAVVSTVVTGTKEEVECSGQGICDTAKGAWLWIVEL